MTQHRLLPGSELHGSLVPAVPRTSRPPAYDGEIIWDQNTFWRGQGGQWQQSSSSPLTGFPVFSWVLNTAAYGSSIPVGAKIQIYYTSQPASTAAVQGGNFMMISTLTVGQDVAALAPYDFSSLITNVGKGCYVLNVQLTDGYGEISSVSDLRITVGFQAPAGSVNIFEFSDSFVDSAGQAMPGLRGFEVINPMSQVVINLSRST